jgi:hypothetical protein
LYATQIRHAPSLLAYDSSLVEAKLKVLSEEVFRLSPLKTAALVAARAPGLLTLSVGDNILPSFEALRDLLTVAVDVDDDVEDHAAKEVEQRPGNKREAPASSSSSFCVHQLVQRAPTLLGYANNTLKAKVSEMRSLVLSSRNCILFILFLFVLCVCSIFVFFFALPLSHAMQKGGSFASSPMP